MYPHSLRLLLVTTIALVGAVAPSVSWADASQSGATPAVAVNPANGNRYVFWRGADGHLYETWSYGSWRGPREMSWTAASMPSAAVTTADHQYVFWRGTDGSIYEAWYLGAWHGPRRLGWTAASAPNVAVNPANDHQYVFWRGTDGSIYEAWWNGGWHGPRRMAWGSVASVPAAAVTTAGHQYVFWQGPDGHLREAWYYGGWSGPRDLTSANHWSAASTLASAPGAAVNPANDHQYVFWRGGDGRVYEVWHYTGWRGPRQLAWSAVATPGVDVTVAEQQEVVWVVPSGHIESASYLNGWTAAVDTGWSIGPGAAGWPSVEVTQTTANLSQRLTPLAPVSFGAAPPAGVHVITVDDRTRYQRINGFGGAMTDSAAWLIYDELAPAQRSALITDLFGVGGAHFSFTLVPMAASDFTRDGRPYTYDDLATGASDPQLTHFSIAHDQAYIIPALREMLANNPGATVFAVPWTAPPWMKANHAYDNIGYRGTLLASEYGPFAQYFVRFLQAYARAGIPVAYVAPQNEPGAPAPYPGMGFSAADEGRWVTQYLRPALQRAGLTTAIYGGDVAWGSSSYQSTLVSSSAVSALTGLAWHCYSGIPTVMNTLHGQAPALDHAVVECATEIQPLAVPVVAIGAVRNWASAVALWNLALDPSGGPVQSANIGCRGCRGMVTIDPRAGTVRFNLAYYQLAQLSRFIQPGAYRVATPNFVTYYVSHGGGAVTAGLDDAAFVNPDGRRVLVVYNTAASATHFAVASGGHAFTYTLPPAATVTFTWRPPS